MLKNPWSTETSQKRSNLDKKWRHSAPGEGLLKWTVRSQYGEWGTELWVQRTSFSEVSKIALVGGGTGGHIIPILSLITHLSLPQKRFFWIGGNASMEQEKAQEAGIRFIPITTYKLTSTKSLGVFLYPFKLLQGIFDARNILKQEQPKLVFSKGGPGSVAVGIAAWTLGIPLHIHESDTVPGFSNKVLGYFATRIFLGFEEARKWFPEHKTTVVGQILHPQFFKKNPSGSIEWKTDKKHIFVSCGSQGSRKIFQALLDQKEHFPDTEWIISLGTLNQNMRSDFEQWEDIQIFDWISQADIPHILDGAEIAITRASATTLAELSTRPIHLIIIPLAISAGDHQLRNARVYEQDGHTVILEQNLDKMDIGNILRSEHLMPHYDTETKIIPLLEVFNT